MTDPCISNHNPKPLFGEELIRSFEEDSFGCSLHGSSKTKIVGMPLAKDLKNFSRYAELLVAEDFGDKDDGLTRGL